MNQRLAILDLGTNTFHLLIADVREDRSFNILFKQEEFVKLGENGLDRIGKKPFHRGVEQIRKYKKVLDEFQPDKIIAFGTAAIRRAVNSDEFIGKIKSICPMEVRKISGDEEAELIYLGVRQAVSLNEHPQLIMDIGGGSTEFIIANEREILWKKSFPVGASVLKQKFHYHEPIQDYEIDHLDIYLNETLDPLLSQLRNFQIDHLIGASGSFDTIAAMVAHEFYQSDLLTGKTSFDISLGEFQFIQQQLVKSDLQQRLAMKGMVAFRAEMMVVAAILAKFVVEKFRIQKITQSAYALKEGVLWKMIQG
jgi:exopolyphosphatase/guanosine-5'-triphosphate,3'-diphosphate pyrophosphatase